MSKNSGIPGGQEQQQKSLEFLVWSCRKKKSGIPAPSIGGKAGVPGGSRVKNRGVGYYLE